MTRNLVVDVCLAVQLLEEQGIVEIHDDDSLRSQIAKKYGSGRYASFYLPRHNSLVLMTHDKVEEMLNGE